MEIFKLYGSIFIKDKDAINSLNKVDKNAKGLGGSIDGLIKKAIGIGAAFISLNGVSNLFQGAIKDAMEAKENMAQLRNVIKSTGGAAGLTAEEVANMAGELQKVTKYSDDAIIQGQNLLLTFTNIGKNVFPDVTEIMLDMSTAMGQDLKSSALQLGKALNDPTKGVTALTRVGVTFTKEQKKMIESLVKAGKVEEAQKVILRELQREFGNSARAAGTTFAGKIEILKNRFGELKEQLGTMLLPIVERLLNKVNDNLPAIERWFEEAMPKLEKGLNWIIDHGPEIIDVISGLVTIFILKKGFDLLSALKAVTIAQEGLNTAMALNPIGAVIVLIGGLVTALGGLEATLERIKELIDWVKHNHFDWPFEQANKILNEKGYYDKNKERLEQDYSDPGYSDYQGYASGTRNAPPGWAWVGENGPELRRLRRGDKILNNSESRQVNNQPVINVYLDGEKVRGVMDKKQGKNLSLSTRGAGL